MVIILLFFFSQKIKPDLNESAGAFESDVEPADILTLFSNVDSCLSHEEGLLHKLEESSSHTPLDTNIGSILISNSVSANLEIQTPGKFIVFYGSFSCSINSILYLNLFLKIRYITLNPGYTSMSFGIVFKNRFEVAL